MVPYNRRRVRGPAVVGLHGLRAMPTLRGNAQKLVEYGLIIALVALVAVTGLVLFGDAIASLLTR
jgi:hypothetical protein